MKKLLIALFLTVTALASQAQGFYDDIDLEARPVDNATHVYEKVDQMPQFPGGEAALMRYVASHLRYPSVCQENGIMGKVTVQFVVTRTGSVGQVKIVRGVDPDLDKEAVRLVKALPKFTPGKLNGEPVNVWYTLPVTFRLQGA